MGKYQYSNTKKQRINFSNICMVTFIVSLPLFLILKGLSWNTNAYYRFFEEIVSNISFALALISVMSFLITNFKDMRLFNKLLALFFSLDLAFISLFPIHLAFQNLSDIDNAIKQKYYSIDGEINISRVESYHGYKSVKFSVCGMDFVADHEFFDPVRKSHYIKITYLPNSKYIMKVDVIKN